LAAPENQPPSRQEGEDGTEEDGGAAETGAVKVSGWEQLGQVILVDQSPIGKTPRSNPAVYTGAFEDIRQVFARAEMASQRGLKASAFSFNSPEGQCERCRGAGFEKIEMQFLSDVFVRCPECDGRRYRAHILEVRVPRVHDQGKEAKDASIDAEDRGGWNIADVLEATVDEGLVFLGGLPESAPARRASAALQILQDVGLGYLRLGQPINTLSGGESQRLKLVGHLAAFARSGRPGMKPALFLFDEPTTGLHFDDVRVLLRVFQRLVDDGHSVLVIEHNLDVVKAADWVVDLGPEAGEEGGRLVVQGPPPVVAACRESHTGEALRQAGWFDVAGGSAPKF
jgi:excinuclease ABC subunit A